MSETLQRAETRIAATVAALTTVVAGLATQVTYMATQLRVAVPQVGNAVQDTDIETLNALANQIEALGQRLSDVAQAALPPAPPAETTPAT